MATEPGWGGADEDDAYAKAEQAEAESWAATDKAIKEGRYHDLDALDEDDDATPVKETADGERTAGDGDDTGVDAVMSYESATEVAKAESDAEFRAQLAEAEQKSRFYDPPPEPLTREEVAAQKTVEMMKTGEWDKFAETLRESNQKLMDDAAIARGEMERDEDGIVVPRSSGEKFDPMTLDSKAFESFTRAAQRGGASPTDIPAGWTYDAWVKAVDGALAGGVER